MKKFLFTLCFLFIVYMFHSCLTGPSDNSKTKQRNTFLPPATGNLTELVLVLPDKIWTSGVGEIIRRNFQSQLKGLPQKESLFNLYNINTSQFTSIFKSHKNILQFIYSDSTYVEKNQSKWSKDQVYTCIYYQSEKKLKDLLLQYGDKIRDRFLRKNQIRRVFALEKDRNTAIEKEIKKKYNFSFLVPSDFEIAAEDKDFIWIRRDLSKLNVIANIWVHRLAYKNKRQLNKTSLIDLRDSIGKLFVQGARAGSYMATEMLYEPDLSLVNKEPYTLSMKGLWTMENDFLGGGFTSYIFLDQKTNSLIYTEGFLYSPNQKKREHILELEAILSTFQF